MAYDSLNESLPPPTLRKILVVEDDEVDRMGFHRCLSSMRPPVSFETAGSVKEARTLAGKHDFDAAILDIRLQDGTAFDLLPLFRDKPAIFVTGQGDEETAIRALKNGAFDYLVKDAAGNYLGKLPSLLDIAANAVRRERERRILHQAIENVSDCLLITDHQGGVFFVNQAASEKFQYSFEELTRRRIFSLLSHRSAPGNRTGGSEAVGRDWLVEGIRKDGSRFSALLHKSSFPEADAQHIHFYSLRDITGLARANRESNPPDHVLDPHSDAAATDREHNVITPLKKAEEALLQSEARFQIALRNAPIFFFAQDKELRYTWFHNTKANPKPETVVGKADGDIFPAESADRLTAIKKQVMESGEGDFREIEIGFKDARYHFEMALDPLRDDKDVIIGITGVAWDITKIKAAEAKVKAAAETAEKATRSKSQFLANMAHEIRTPLNGLLGTVELLESGDLTPDEHAQYFGILRSSASVLLSLVNDILDFSKIEAGKMELESIPFSIRDSASTVLEMFAQRSAEKGVEIMLDLDPALPARIMGDPGRFKQILINLVGNALKFTPAGYVLIRIQAGEVRRNRVPITISVLDSGIGIPEDKIARLFEKFSQADASTTRHFGGTGLGLSIASKLVEAMGGTLRVESRHGEGSRFWFGLEVEYEESDAGSDPSESLAHSRRLLLVRHGGKTRNLFSDSLIAHGFRVETHSNLESAEAELASGREGPDPYSVVIIDSQFGLRQVEAWAMAIRSGGLGKDLRLIYLPAFGLKGDSLRLQKAGFSAYLSKPLDIGILVKAIVRSLRTNPGEIITRHDLLPESAQVKPPPAPGSAGTQYRILLVDDNLVNRIVVGKVLQQSGYRVEVVEGGRQALKTLANGFDLILMDCQMPDMDGHETAEAIRRLPGTHASIPIIALSANTSEADRKRAIESGMDDFLSKPFKKSDLHSLLGRYLSRKP